MRWYKIPRRFPLSNFYWRICIARSTFLAGVENPLLSLLPGAKTLMMVPLLQIEKIEDPIRRSSH